MTIYQIQKAIWYYRNGQSRIFEGYENFGNPFLRREDALNAMPYEGEPDSMIHPEYIIQEIKVEE